MRIRKMEQANYRQTDPNCRCLATWRNYNAAEIRAIAGVGSTEDIDVVAGGPPCQAFSTAGARRGFQDERGNVFLHFVDVALELNPRFIVIENVRGLLSAPMKHRPHRHRGDGFPALGNEESAGGALAFVLQLLNASGYEVSFNLYNSANFGTPQTRERVILVCSRDGKKVQHLSPTHAELPTGKLQAWRTFGEAVEGLEERDLHHLQFPEERLRYYRLLGPGQYWKHLPKELQHKALGNSFFSEEVRRVSTDDWRGSAFTHSCPPCNACDRCSSEESRNTSASRSFRMIGRFKGLSFNNINKSEMPYRRASVKRSAERLSPTWRVDSFRFLRDSDFLVTEKRTKPLGRAPLARNQMPDTQKDR